MAPRKRDRGGGGRNPGNQAQFKEIMTYTSAKLRGLIQLAVLGYLTHNGWLFIIQCVYSKHRSFEYNIIANQFPLVVLHKPTFHARSREAKRWSSSGIGPKNGTGCNPLLDAPVCTRGLRYRFNCVQAPGVYFTSFSTISWVVMDFALVRWHLRILLGIVNGMTFK